jgi:predicted nucleic acid-binding Zn ribbon protein
MRSLKAIGRSSRSDTCVGCTKIPADQMFCTDRCLIKVQSQHKRVQLYEANVEMFMSYADAGVEEATK